MLFNRRINTYPMLMLLPAVRKRTFVNFYVNTESELLNSTLMSILFDRYCSRPLLIFNVLINKYNESARRDNKIKINVRYKIKLN